MVAESLPVEITPASEDLSAPALGCEAERTLHAISLGGNGVLINRTVWDVYSGQQDCCNDLADFLQVIDQCPRLRFSADLRTLTIVRVLEELVAMPEQPALGARVWVSLQDALLLMSQVRVASVD